MSQLRPEARVLFCVVRLHRGVDFSIEDGVADLALCHLPLRGGAAVGDLAVGVSCKPTARFTPTNLATVPGSHLLT